MQYSRGEGSGPEYSVAFIQNHGGRSRRGRSQVQVRGRTEEYGDDSFRGNSKFLFSFKHLRVGTLTWSHRHEKEIGGLI